MIKARIKHPDDLSICCFLWNVKTYLDGRGFEYVNKLYSSIKRNCSYPFRFFCFFESEDDFNPFLEGINILPLRHVWRRNLRKLLAFKADNGLTGRVVMMDLDVVIVDSIDEIVRYGGQFGCVAPRMGGAVVSFQAGELHNKLFRPMMKNAHAIQQRTRGSERMYYEEKLKYNCDFWQSILPGQVLSYKNDCRGITSMRNARIISFHGQPKPHQVNKGWIKDNWRI